MLLDYIKPLENNNIKQKEQLLLDDTGLNLSSQQISVFKILTKKICGPSKIKSGK